MIRCKHSFRLISAFVIDDSGLLIYWCEECGTIKEVSNGRHRNRYLKPAIAMNNGIGKRTTNRNQRTARNQEIVKKYLKEGMSGADLAKEYDLSRMRIHQILEAAGVTRRYIKPGIKEFRLKAGKLSLEKAIKKAFGSGIK